MNCTKKVYVLCMSRCVGALDQPLVIHGSNSPYSHCADGETEAQENSSAHLKSMQLVGGGVLIETQN